MAAERASSILGAPAPGTAPPTAQNLVASSGISPRLWRLYAQAWLICLLFPLLSLVQHDVPPAELALAIAGLALYVVSYTWVMWTHPVRSPAHHPPRLARSLLLLISLTTLVLVLSAVFGHAFLWLFVGVSAIAGVTLPLRDAFGVVVVLTLLTLGVGVAMDGGLAQADWLHIVPLALLVRGLGVDMIGIARLAAALRDGHRARQELAHLAVVEERLRVARDLHDLLGHTLSLIVLKSELARRLAEQEPQRAAQEIAEVERVSRQALREVREAVSGYRQPGLASELEYARQLLDAAGVACTVENTAVAISPAVDAILGWTVRESVTNVIRHSRARACQIRVTSDETAIHAEIANDDGRQRLVVEPSYPLGNGLAGLRERVLAAGGMMEAVPLTESGGFRVRVVLPRTGAGKQHMEQR